MTRKSEAVETILDLIIEDLSDRYGIGDEWNQIDADTQAAIRAIWAEIITANLPAGSARKR